MENNTVVGIEAIRGELATFERQREDGVLKGDYTAREIALVAQLDAWAAQQTSVADPMADIAAIFGAE